MHVAYPKIGQFRHFLKEIREDLTYAGRDEESNPIYKPRTLPVIPLFGTAKLHGTNAAIGWSEKKGFWYQSRENLIAPDNDNYGFATWASQNLEFFQNIINASDIK